MKMKTLIISHGDGDGIISAAILKQLDARGREVLITQPFLLDKINTLAFESIIVVDIAVNNKDVAMTTNFIKENSKKIVYWIDHHPGTEILSDLLGEKLIFDPHEPSCPSLDEKVRP